MGVLGVFLYDYIEVFHCLFMLVNHLVCLGSLVDIPQICGDVLDALLEGEDGFLKFLETAVC